ncbi:MAG: HesA/MoeB/ThiF family protein [Anaerolineales bacterium]|nr:HesA/MoeB/ThiF family protein [Anaerolineales bacterium]
MSEDRYERLRQIEGWDQESLRQAVVMVAGVGALGNEVAKNLALLGIGFVILVDFDRVALSNLSRSVLFRAEHQGKPKTEVAAETLRQINPDVRIMTMNADVSRHIGTGVFRRAKVVFGCVDNVAARYHINRRCWMAGTPWIDGGISEHIGIVKVFRPPEGACYECTMSPEDRQAFSPKRNSCSDPSVLSAGASVPTTPLIASVTGAMMVQQMVNLMRGQVYGGSGWYFNALQGEASPLHYDRQAVCFSHSAYIDQPIIDLPASSSDYTLSDILEWAASDLGPGAHIELGRSVVTRLVCPVCGQSEDLWLDRDDLVAEHRCCPHCQSQRQPTYVQSLGPESAQIDQPLSSLGIPPLEILVARRGEDYRFYELSTDAAEIMKWA